MALFPNFLSFLFCFSFYSRSLMRKREYTRLHTADEATNAEGGTLMCPALPTKSDHFIWEKERILIHCHKTEWQSNNGIESKWKVSIETWSRSHLWKHTKNEKLQSVINCVFLDLGTNVTQKWGTQQSSVSDCFWVLIPIWLFSIATWCHLFLPHFPRELNGETASNHMWLW